MIWNTQNNTAWNSSEQNVCNMIFCVQDCAPVFGSGKHSPELSCLVIAYLKERKKHIYSIPCRTVYYVMFMIRDFVLRAELQFLAKRQFLWKFECLIAYLKGREICIAYPVELYITFVVYILMIQAQPQCFGNFRGTLKKGSKSTDIIVYPLELTMFMIKAFVFSIKDRAPVLVEKLSWNFNVSVNLKGKKSKTTVSSAQQSKNAFHPSIFLHTSILSKVQNLKYWSFVFAARKCSLFKNFQCFINSWGRITNLYVLNNQNKLLSI